MEPTRFGRGMRWLLMACGPMNLVGVAVFAPPFPYLRDMYGLPGAHPLYLPTPIEPGAFVPPQRVPTLPHLHRSVTSRDSDRKGGEARPQDRSSEEHGPKASPLLTFRDSHTFGSFPQLPLPESPRELFRNFTQYGVDSLSGRSTG